MKKWNFTVRVEIVRGGKVQHFELVTLDNGELAFAEFCRDTVAHGLDSGRVYYPPSMIGAISMLDEDAD